MLKLELLGQSNSRMNAKDQLKSTKKQQIKDVKTLERKFFKKHQENGAQNQLQKSQQNKKLVELRGERYLYQRIGQGAYGDIFKLVHQNTRKITCVKVIELQDSIN